MLTNIFIKKLTNDSKLNIENLVILTCAIFIASIGLNMNSTATIIGAMLISPLNKSEEDEDFTAAFISLFMVITLIVYTCVVLFIS